jgi:hypothetical protein
MELCLCLCRMCLAAMAPLPRMRHWSCPDDLLLESPAAALPLAPTRSCPWEAEDLVSLAVTSLAAPQRPSRWEERVLEVRERRVERRRRRLSLVAAAATAAAANLKRRPGTIIVDDKASDNDDNYNIEDITEGVYYRLTSV